VLFPFTVSYNDNYIYLDDVRHPEDDPMVIEKDSGRVGEFSQGKYVNKII
jgi:hypothetical protein